jgi:hypothetical protein
MELMCEICYRFFFVDEKIEASLPAVPLCSTECALEWVKSKEKKDETEE